MKSLFGFTFSLALYFFINPCALGDIPKNSITPQKALEALKSIEKNFAAIKFSTISVAELPLFIERYVVYDWSRNQYMIEVRKTSEWIDGASSYVSCIEKISFDGKVYREWQSCNAGTTFPKSDIRSEGIITEDQSTSSLNKNFNNFKNGIGLGFPFLFFDFYAKNCKLEAGEIIIREPTYLSNYIKNWQDNSSLVSIIEETEGIWTITVQYNTIFANITRIVLLYDLNAGGYVTNVKYYTTPRGNTDISKMFLENEYVLDLERKGVAAKIGKWHCKKDSFLR